MNKLLPWVALACVCITMVVSGVLVFVRRDALMTPGEEVVYDDFGFSIVGCRVAASIGEVHTTEADRVFRIVALKVSNHAKRVSFDTRKYGAVLVGVDCKEYGVAERAQQSLAAESTSSMRCPPEIAAGESCVAEWAFETPRDAHNLTLRISWGSIGDKVDWLILGDRRLTVE